MRGGAASFTAIVVGVVVITFIRRAAATIVIHPAIVTLTTAGVKATASTSIAGGDVALRCVETLLLPSFAPSSIDVSEKQANVTELRYSVGDSSYLKE